MKINKIYFWASDYSEISGEGILARMFVKKLLKINKDIRMVNIKSNLIKKTKKNKKELHNTVLHKYVGPVIGIIKLWGYFLMGCKTCYINYLPLWNFLVFILVPPKCILGPITGTIEPQKKFLFKNFFEKISLIIIRLKFKKILFSNNFYKDKFKSAHHNFIIDNLKFTFLSKRKYQFDFIFYNRISHNSKNTFFINLINELIKKKFRIVIVGDYLNILGVKNLGYLRKKKLIKYMKITKCAVGNRENLYSFFIQDCLKNNLIVFYNNSFKKFENFSLKNFFPISIYNYKLAIKQIMFYFNKKLSQNKFNKLNFYHYFKLKF